MDKHSRQFIEALTAESMENLRKTPKSDLHNHFILGGSREHIKQRTGVEIPILTHKLKSMDEMHKWVGENISHLFDSEERRTLAIESCFQQAKDDGVTILEIGDDVWANGHYYDYQIDSLINTFQETHNEIAFEMEFRFQIGLSRHCPIDLLEKWIEPFFERDCFHSIDLYSDELAQPIKNFKGIYRKAKEKGLVLKAHVGEWGNADSVKEAVEELELDEVQHGISAVNSTSIMYWLADNGIPLNICPTSNVMLGRVMELKRHPIRKLFDHGVRVTINTDDVLVFNQGVTDEYLNLYRERVFTAEELDIIRIYGLDN